MNARSFITQKTYLDHYFFLARVNIYPRFCGQPVWQMWQIISLRYIGEIPDKYRKGWSNCFPAKIVTNLFLKRTKGFIFFYTESSMKISSIKDVYCIDSSR